MRNQTRAHYLSLARVADEPEELTGDYPLDLPDWDWPDAPDPRVNDSAIRGIVVGWMIMCTVIIFGCLIYLALFASQ